MNKPLESIKLDNGDVIEIFQDEINESPREWDNLGHIINFHDRYNLGDENTSKSKMEREMTPDDASEYITIEGWQDVERYLIEQRGAINVLPLMVYEHSGITMYVGTTGDRWDSSRIGYIYTTKELIERQGVDEANVDSILRREVETMDKYLRGEVYEYQIVRYVKCDHGDTHREFLDGCGGYYSVEDAMKDAKDVVEVKS